MRIDFRPLVEADLPMLHRWLNEPEVVRWWEGDDVSFEAVQRDYWSDVDGDVEHWIAESGGRPVGWIQCYPAEGSPDEFGEWSVHGVHRRAAGIDYLVAGEAGRARGLGTAMIRAFVHDVVFGRHCDWTQACAAPYAANVASWRALEKAGFRRLAVLDDPDGPCNLMAFDRPA